MRLFGFVALALVLAAPATAEPLTLTIRDGRVWLIADDVSVRQILVEWERVGHTRIVNGDRIPGGRVTLRLTGAPEQEALDLLLRNAAGYIAAPRTAAVAGASRFDRIMILPTTSAPPVAAAVRGARPAPVERPAQTPRALTQVPPPRQPVQLPQGVQRAIGPDGQPVPDDQDETIAAPQQSIPIPPGFDGNATDQIVRPTIEYPQTPGPTPSTPGGSAVPGMPVPAPPQAK